MFDYFHVHRPFIHHRKHEKKDKAQVPQRIEMLHLYCTAVGFISKNEEYKLENNV